MKKYGEKKLLRDFILGGQDGLVNVLGIILGVAIATNETRIVLIAGIAALFAESLSMGAVAFTSSKAARDYYFAMMEKERLAIKKNPKEEVKEIRQIFKKKGFKGKCLDTIVQTVTKKKKLWVETMLMEEFRMLPDDYENPIQISLVVLLATTSGSLIPLLPFFYFPVFQATIIALVISGITLFIAGVVKAKKTYGSWQRSGTEMLAIGMVAAVAGFIVGEVLKYVL